MFFRIGLIVPLPLLLVPPLIAALLTAASCTAPCGGVKDGGSCAYEDKVDDLYQLAVRFAPRLFLNDQEPYELKTVIPVFHPCRPLIAYHLFFEDDAVYSGEGKSMDHELVWVQYDPVTLMVMDVFTFWHRTVLRTSECVMDAKSGGQRPCINVQWGQHGMLPEDWQGLNTVRPRLELVLHYSLVARGKSASAEGAAGGDVVFHGSYEEYTSFTWYVDSTPYIREENIITSENPADDISSRISGSYAEKKEWPYW
jgi:hypothetical protein